MTHLETELNELKTNILEMWDLVINQMDKGEEALRTFDRDLALEVVETEKRVNMFDLKIDKDCEHIFALFQPVATDLRLILTSLKINNNLERIGDIAASIAEFTLKADRDFNKDILERTRIFEMYAIARNMLSDTREAFDKEDTRLARTMFNRDNLLDGLDSRALDVLTQSITEDQDQVRNNLLVMSMVHKLERVGDQTKNIAEEIIFYFEAKVLKHKKRKEKLK